MTFPTSVDSRTPTIRTQSADPQKTTDVFSGASTFSTLEIVSAGFSATGSSADSAARSLRHAMMPAMLQQEDQTVNSTDALQRHAGMLL